MAFPPSLDRCVQALYFLSTTVLRLPSFSTLPISSVDGCVPGCCPLCWSIPHSSFHFLLLFYPWNVNSSWIHVTSDFKRRPVSACYPSHSYIQRSLQVCFPPFAAHSPLIWSSCSNDTCIPFCIHTMYPHFWTSSPYLPTVANGLMGSLVSCPSLQSAKPHTDEKACLEFTCTHLRCGSLCCPLYCHLSSWMLMASDQAAVLSHSLQGVSPQSQIFKLFFYFSRVFLIFKLTSFLKSILVISWLLFKLGWRSSKANSVIVIFFLVLSGFRQTPFRKVWGILFTHSYSCCISCRHPSHIIKKMPCRFPHMLLYVKAQS